MNAHPPRVSDLFAPRELAYYVVVRLAPESTPQRARIRAWQHGEIADEIAISSGTWGRLRVPDSTPVDLDMMRADGAPPTPLGTWTPIRATPSPPGLTPEFHAAGRHARAIPCRAAATTAQPVPRDDRDPPLTGVLCPGCRTVANRTNPERMLND